MRRFLPLALLAAIPACGDGAPCEAGELARRLDAAGDGAVVELGACRVEGSFTVPPGVTLRGAGPATVIAAPPGEVALDTHPTAGATTRIESLSIEAGSGGFGVRATGVGGLVLADVAIALDGGVGFGARDLASLRVERVAITGPITDANAGSVPDAATASTGGAYGFAIVDVANGGDPMSAAPAELFEVDVVQVGPWGGIVANSAIRMRSCRIADVLGTALLVEGGSADIADSSFERVVAGIQALPPYALAATAGASITTSGVTIADSEGVGLLHASSTGSHTGARLAGNRFGGAWVQDSDGVVIEGAGTMIEANGLAGVAIVSSSDVIVRGATVARTTSQLSLIGELGAVETGDGVQLLGGIGAVELSDLTLDDNARAGLVIDVRTGSLGSIAIANVTARASGTAFGAIAQDDAMIVPPGTWDAGITREGTAAANDAAQTELLGMVGAIRPVLVPASGPAGL